MDNTHRFVTIDPDGPVAIVTLNRPDKRNALSLDLMGELTAAFRSFHDRSDVRAIVLAANGKVFSSGHDLAEMVGRSLAEYRGLFNACAGLMQTIMAIPQPVIAEVQGLATAAGCQLVATCDLAVASEDAAFATPGVKIGLFCTTPMVPLTRAVGRKRAMEMLLTGRRVSASEACEWGLVNAVVPRTELRQASLGLARQIAESSALIVSIGKQAFYSQIDLELPKAYEYATEVMSANATAADAQEGISAFLGKRSPVWSGR